MSKIANKITENMHNESKQENIAFIINQIVTDSEFFCGGIPAIDKYLQEKGFTNSDCANIEYGLYKIAKRIAKRI